MLSFTNSTGDVLAVGVTEPWSSAEFARLVRAKVGPWLEASYPAMVRITVLLDGEKVLHSPEAKTALGEFNIVSMADWPKYSPDLNPQENVWARAEPLLRANEKGKDTFSTFKQRVLKATMMMVVASVAMLPMMVKLVLIVTSTFDATNRNKRRHPST